MVGLLIQPSPNPEIDVCFTEPTFDLRKEEKLKHRTKHREQAKKKDPWKDSGKHRIDHCIRRVSPPCGSDNSVLILRQR